MCSANDTQQARLGQRSVAGLLQMPSRPRGAAAEQLAPGGSPALAASHRRAGGTCQRRTHCSCPGAMVAAYPLLQLSSQGSPGAPLQRSSRRSRGRSPLPQRLQSPPARLHRPGAQPWSPGWLPRWRAPAKLPGCCAGCHLHSCAPSRILTCPGHPRAGLRPGHRCWAAALEPRSYGHGCLRLPGLGCCGGAAQGMLPLMTQPWLLQWWARRPVDRQQGPGWLRRWLPAWPSAGRRNLYAGVAVSVCAAAGVTLPAGRVCTVLLSGICSGGCSWACPAQRQPAPANALASSCYTACAHAARDAGWRACVRVPSVRVHSSQLSGRGRPVHPVSAFVHRAAGVSPVSLPGALPALFLLVLVLACASSLVGSAPGAQHSCWADEHTAVWLRAVHAQTLRLPGRAHCRVAPASRPPNRRLCRPCHTEHAPAQEACAELAEQLRAPTGRRQQLQGQLAVLLVLVGVPLPGLARLGALAPGQVLHLHRGWCCQRGNPCTRDGWAGCAYPWPGAAPAQQ